VNVVCDASNSIIDDCRAHFVYAALGVGPRHYVQAANNRTTDEWFGAKLGSAGMTVSYCQLDYRSRSSEPLCNPGAAIYSTELYREIPVVYTLPSLGCEARNFAGMRHVPVFNDQ